MKKILLHLIIVTIFCSTSDIQAQITGSIIHDGIERDYRLFLPSNYQSYESLPLVFNLHGFDSNGSQQELYSGMNQVADTAKFFVCYAEGFKYNGPDQAWNVGWSFGSDKDDVGFISALIDSLSLIYNINENDVFSCGMSNGGFMSYKLACELNDKIKAIASVTGSMEPGEAQNCTPDISIPVMQIHGTQDPIVSYNGAPNVSIGIEDLLSKWVGVNDCELSSDTIQVPNIDPTDGTTSERIEYNDCDGQSRVVFFKVFGGQHTWPDAPIDLGVTSHDFNASVEIWRFFRPYTSPLLVSNKKLVSISHIDANPNPFDHTLILESKKEDLKSIKIHNAVGQLVYAQSDIGSPKFQLSTAGFQSGVYFVNIETNEGVAVLKTIKQ